MRELLHRRYVLFPLLAVLLALAALVEVRTSAAQALVLSQRGRLADLSRGGGPQQGHPLPADRPLRRAARLHPARQRSSSRLEGAGYRVERQARLSPGLDRLARVGRSRRPTARRRARASRSSTARSGRSTPRATPRRSTSASRRCPPLLVRHRALHREPRAARPGPPLPQSGGRLAPARQGGRRRGARAPRRRAALDRRRARCPPSSRSSGTRRTGARASPSDKLHQMVSASLRAYQGGAQTRAARRQIVVDYLNSLPLAAAPGHGEVHGMGDGLRVWYGLDFAEANALLAGQVRGLRRRSGPGVFKRALSLILALRRPYHYLVENRARPRGVHRQLPARDGPRGRDRRAPARRRARGAARRRARAAGPADGLRGAQGREPGAQPAHLPAERARALRSRPARRHRVQHAGRARPGGGRAAPAVAARARDARAPRARAARSSSAAAIPRACSTASRSTSAAPTPTGSASRPTTSTSRSTSTGARGSTSGSTAKLRTLISYLEAIAALHDRYARLAPAELAAARPHPKDRMGAWAIEYLAAARGTDKTLQAMLEASLERKYSASPAEAFFTGGGLHTFGNFDREDDRKVMTVREALPELGQPRLHPPDARRGHQPPLRRPRPRSARAPGRPPRPAPRSLPDPLRRPGGQRVRPALLPEVPGPDPDAQLDAAC